MKFLKSEKIIKYIKNLKVNKIATNSGWLIGDKVLTMLIGIIVTAMVARYFGAEKFGIYNFALSFVTLFSAFSTLGFETINVKAIVQKEESEGTILFTSLLFRVCGGILLVIFATTTIMIFQPNDFDTHTIVFILAVAMIFRSLEVFEYWIQAHQMAKISTIVRVLVYLISSALKILLVVFKGNIIHFSLIYTLDVILIGVGLSIAYNKYKLDSEAKIKFSYGFKTLSKSWYLILSGLMITVYMQIDKVMLGTMLLNKSEVGIYSAASSVASMWYFIPMAIIVSFKPIILQQKEIKNSSYLETIQFLYSLVAFLGVFFGFVILFFSEAIIFLLFGSDFTGAAIILSVSVWAGTFALLGSARSVWLISEGLQKFTLTYTFVGFITNILLNAYLIPKFGGIGAAFATLISQFISNVLVLLFFNETRISSYMIMKAFDIRILIKHFSNRISSS